MAGHITDPDVQLLVAISESIRGDYTERDAEWAGSPFSWIKTRASRTVGAIGEQLVSGWCAAKGLDVTRALNSQHDRVIGGFKTEIKFSTTWHKGGYTFQQFRDQDYELAVCLGIAPFDAHCWVLPKHVLLQYVIGHTPQHTGSGGTDTFWIQNVPPAGFEWMNPWGGRLSDAFRVLSRLNKV